MSDHHSFLQRRKSTMYERRLWELKEGLRSRINELEAVLKCKEAERPADNQPLLQKAFDELKEARDVLHHVDHPRRLPGAHLAVAQTHLDLAHSLMLRLSPLDDVKALLPGVVAFTREHLPLGDERRSQVDELLLSVRKGGELDDTQREILIDAVTVARQALMKENLRVRSFTYVVHGVSVALAIIAALVALCGGFWPETVPLCFKPTGIGVVCPTGSDTSSSSKDPNSDADDAYAMAASGWDYPVVEFVGLVAAAVAAAASLRRIRGTSTPYNVPVALALLKLPTGALTAVLGLLLMRGEFIPGLSALDSSGQVIAWAVIFGYAQQIFTRFVDNQAQVVLSAVGGPNATPRRPRRDPEDPAA